jgi:predicted chitinase
MKHLKLFTPFINEQQDKPKIQAGQDATGTSKDVAASLSGVGDLFKKYGLEDWVGGGATGGVSGTGAAAANRKVPTEAEKQQNIKILNDTLQKNGFTDQNIRAAIIGIIGNETGWAPSMEESYYKTGFPRMREMFTSRVDGHEAEIESWKKLNQDEFDKNFWELVYGYQTKVGASLGNTSPGDGAKYRGGGFNGITGRGEYQKMQDLYNAYKSANPDAVKDLPNIDIVSNPDQINDPKIAAQICAMYFLAGIQSGLFKQKYPDITLQGPNDRDKAVVAVANINAGLGNNMNSGPFVAYVSNGKGYANDLVSKNMV